MVVTQNPAVGTTPSHTSSTSEGKGRCVRAVPFLVLVVVAVLISLAVVGLLYLLVRRWL